MGFRGECIMVGEGGKQLGPRQHRCEGPGAKMTMTWAPAGSSSSERRQARRETRNA